MRRRLVRAPVFLELRMSVPRLPEDAILAAGLRFQLSLSEALDLELTNVRGKLIPRGHRRLLDGKRLGDCLLCLEMFDDLGCAHVGLYSHVYSQWK